MTRIDDANGYTGQVRALTFEGDLPSSALSDLGRFIDRLPIEPVADQTWANLVTNLGRQQMTAIIVGETTALATYMALSTSVIVPALADTVGTIVDRKATQLLSVHASISSYYQRYASYFSTLSFSSTGINTEALLDALSTGATTNLWADAVVTISKSTTQSLIVEHRIQATT